MGEENGGMAEGQESEKDNQSEREDTEIDFI